MIDNWPKLQKLCAPETPDLVYMFQAIKRKKDNPEMERSESVLRTVVTHEVYSAKLHDRMKEYVVNDNARIYFRVGAIDAKVAALRTIAKMAEMVASNQFNVREAYDSVCGSMKTGYWVIDIDDRHIDLAMVSEHLIELQTNARQDPLAVLTETPNGFHMITRQFDSSKMKFPFDIKKNQPTILYANEFGRIPDKYAHWTFDRLDAEILAMRKARAALDVCEHGVQDGDWCEPCNKEYKRAAVENESP